MKKSALSFALLLSLGTQNILAADSSETENKASAKEHNMMKFDVDNLQLRFGPSINSTESNNFQPAIGYQLSVAYALPLHMINKTNFAVEAGYMNSGDFDGKPMIQGNTIETPDTTNIAGVWASGSASFMVSTKVSLSAQLGYDFAESGILYGAGAAYSLSKKFSVNAQYVIRDTVTSREAGVTYFF